MIGSVLHDTFALIDEVERGQLSTTYAGKDLSQDGVLVTVQVIHPGLAGRESFTRRFHSEAEKLARVNNPRVAPVLAYGNDEGVDFVVFGRSPYLPSLRDILRQEGILPLLRAVTIARGIAEGLAAAHAVDLYHRYLYPEVVFLKEGDEVCLGDFGLAWGVNLARLSEKEEWCRSSPYLAPELVRQEPADARTDLYDLGVILAEMVIGQAPSRDHLPSSLPSDVAPVIRRCLALNREARPAHARELISVLDTVRQKLTPGGALLGTLPTDLVGRSLGGYELLSLLGRGGMAEVYLARQASLDRQVAIKVLPASAVRDPLIVARFQREAQVVSQLRHPNILPIYDFVSREELAYIVMEYADAGTLKERLGKPLDLSKAMPILSQVGAALDHAHSAGVIHRDVKPSNILMNKEGRAYLTDFGLAHIKGGTHKLTLTGAAMGTPEYMAPEQAQGKPITGLADIYSLGIIVYEILTGTLPYQADTPIAVAMKHITDPLPPLRERNPNVPAAVEEVLFKMLAKEPRNRFATAYEFLAALALAGGVEQWFTGLLVSRMLLEEGERRPARPPDPTITPSLAPIPANLVPIVPENSFSLQKLRRLGRGRATRLAYSPDGQYLAVSTSIAVELWDCKTWRLKYRMREHSWLVESVTFSLDGRLLASASWDASVRLWDVATGELVAVLAGHKGSVLTVQFSPDGKLLATGGEDEVICLWDVASHQLLASLKGHTDFVRGVGFSPDSRILASTGADGTVRLWDSLGRRAGPVLRGPEGAIWALAYSPDGRLLATGGSAKVISLWDPMKGQALGCLRGHTSTILALAFSPNSELLASGGQDNVIRLWNPRTGQELNRLEGHTDAVTGLSFGPDGVTLASVSRDRTVRLWNARTGQEIHRLEGYTPQVTSLAFRPDGQAIASGSDDQTIRLWSLSQPFQIVSFVGHSGLVHGVAFSPNGQFMASASRDQTVRLWHPESGREMGVLKGHNGPVYVVAFSPDSRFLASGGLDGQVILWDAQQGRQIQALRAHLGDALALAFSQDGQVLATGGADEAIRLWEMGTWRPLKQLWASSGVVRGLALSQVGGLLASAGADGRVRLWDLAQGIETGALVGHTADVNSVAFNPDGTLLASAGDDNSVRVWDVKSGRELANLSGHTAWVNSVSFSPDSRLMASGSMDGTLQLWGIRGK